MSISPQRKQEIIDALRRGTVPRSSLDAFAVGLDRFEPALDEELKKVGSGGSVFKAVRGEYGCGKTFFAGWTTQCRGKCQTIRRNQRRHRSLRCSEFFAGRSHCLARLGTCRTFGDPR